MTMRTFMRTTGAALLTAALGMTWSGSAHALKFVVDAGDNPMTAMNAVESITYAKETLLSGTDNVQEVEDDATTYYKLTRNHHVSAPPEVTGETDDLYILTYDLSGMVFCCADVVANPTGFNRAAGGTPGDEYVVFRSATGAVADGTAIELTAKFAVSASGGSLTMTAQNRTLEEILGGGRATKKHGPVSVRVSPALVEKVEPAEITAKAALGFKGFGGNDTSLTRHAALGSIMIGVAGEGLVDDQNQPDTTKQLLVAVADENDDITEATVSLITHITVAAGDPLNNTAMVDGGTSFVEKIGFGVSCDASGPTPDIRKPTADDPSVYTDEFDAQNALTFTDSMSLCILVDGVTPILKGEYTITTTYKGIENAAFPPNDGNPKVHTIGMIGRDGANFQIPFLTKNAKFKQRISMVNRGSETTYTLGELRTVDSGSVVALGLAEGTLSAGSHTVVKVAEMIDVSGSSRASGTLTMPADKAAITVSLDIVNPESGAIDTVILIADD